MINVMSGLLAAVGALESAAAAYPVTTAALGQVGGSMLTNAMTRSNQRMSLAQSKELYDYQTDYKKLFNKMVAAGISPAAAAQGLSGAVPSMQAVGSHAAPDVSSLGSNLVAASQNPSVVSKNEASAARDRAEALKADTEAALNEQSLLWNPRRWHQEINESKSRVRVNRSNAWYLDEMAETVRQERPWKIQGLIKGLEQCQALIDYYRSSSRNQSAQAYFWDNKGINESYATFEARWRAGLIRSGWNPSSSFMQNLMRLSFTDPRRASVVLDNGQQFLRDLDQRAKDSFGENYKRNALIGYGLIKGLEYYDRHSESRSRRRSNNVRSLVGLAGLAGSIGSKSPVPAALSGSAMDDSDWFDYFSRF